MKLGDVTIPDEKDPNNGIYFSTNANNRLNPDNPTLLIQAVKENQPSGNDMLLKCGNFSDIQVLWLIQVK